MRPEIGPAGPSQNPVLPAPRNSSRMLIEMDRTSGHERPGRGGLLVVRPNPPAMLEDRQPSMVHSASRAGEEQTVHNLWMTRGALEFLPSQQHFNAMVRCPHAHHNLHTRGYNQVGLSRATCRLLVEIKSALQRPHRSSVATLTAYSCLYFVRSDAVQRIPTQSSSSAKDRPHSASRASVDRFTTRRSAKRTEDSLWTASA